METHLKLLYDQYFEGYDESQKAMAASVESLRFCQDLIREHKVENILDCGSGISSVFFNLLNENVTTVDDDAYWADKTRHFINQNLEKSVTITPIESVLDFKYDFVFYDYGNIETRIYYFLKALNLSTRFFYIDDIHVSYYREYIQAKCKNYKMRFLPSTVDRWGRYGALIIKDV